VVSQRTVPPRATPRRTVQAGNARANVIEVDVGPLPSLFGCQLVNSFDLARSKHPRFGAVSAVRGEFDELAHVIHHEYAVNFPPHHAFDTITRLLVVNSNPLVALDNRNPGQCDLPARSASSAIARVDTGSISSPAEVSRRAEASVSEAKSARQAATRAVAGADVSAAMLARIILGWIVAGSTPPSAANAFAVASARVGRPRRFLRECILYSFLM